MIKDLPKSLIDAASEILDSKPIVNEVVSIPADGLAKDGVIGARQKDEVPVAADVVADADPMNGKVGYRILIEYVNSWHEFVPTTDQPAAESIDQLKSLCSSLPGYKEIILPAIERAIHLPHDEPRYKGNK